MKIKATLKAFALASLLVVAAQANTLAQDEQQQPQSQPQQERPRTVGQEQPQPTPAQTESDEVLVTDEKIDEKPDEKNAAAPQDVSAEAQAKRREQLSEEESAILPYYNNYLTTYHLGPEDVISVTVFGHPNYSKESITVPPNGKVSYPLIGNIFVAGKTTDQVEDEIRKRLDEYVIDPQVTVALEKAVSARYSVLGDVVQPGIRVMTRRLSVYEALAEAGGVLPTGDKGKVVILRRQPDGNVRPIQVNIKAIERGKATEIAYLVPGDQVVVPGNKLKTWQQIMNFLPIMNFARIFGVPF